MRGHPPEKSNKGAKKNLIQNHMRTPMHPGAMTPAQILRRDLAKAACIITTAAAVALFAIMFNMFN